MRRVPDWHSRPISASTMWRRTFRRTFTTTHVSPYGDVVKVDVGAHVDGYIGDTAASVEVGTKNWTDLINASARALTFATEMIADGTPVNAIGGAVERSIKESGFRPVVNLNGHEVKQYNLHAGLSIPNYDDGTTTKVRDGMTIAVEPFATNGAGSVDNAKAGNIYRIIRDRQLKDAETMRLFEQIKTEFGTLPFCERWCQKLDKDAPHLLKNMFRHGVIMSYPMLQGDETRDGVADGAYPCDREEPLRDHHQGVVQPVSASPTPGS